MASFSVKQTGGGSTLKGGDVFKSSLPSGPQTIDLDDSSSGIPSAEALGALTLIHSQKTFRMRVLESELGASGVYVLRLVEDNARIYGSLVAPGQAQLGSVQQSIPLIGASDLGLLDISILEDTHDNPGFYMLAYPVNGTPADWPGAIVYRSTDGGVTFLEFNGLFTQAKVGVATGVLATPGTQWASWDRTNTVQVQMINGTLSNASIVSTLNLTNLALLGSEIIGFTTATDDGNGKYTLSGLIRGRFGTESHIGGHVAGEAFYLLEVGVASLERADGVVSELNLARDYRAVTPGGVFDDGNVTTFTNTGNGLKPYSVAQPRATRDGSNNIDVTWKRRSRLRNGWTAAQDSALGEASESYEIDVYDSGFTSFKRTLTSTSQTVEYTIGDQTTDFGGAQDPVGFRIYQTSADVGRGYVKQAVL